VKRHNKPRAYTHSIASSFSFFLFLSFLSKTIYYYLLHVVECLSSAGDRKVFNSASFLSLSLSLLRPTQTKQIGQKSRVDWYSNLDKKLSGWYSRSMKCRSCDLLLSTIVHLRWRKCSIGEFDVFVSGTTNRSRIHRHRVSSWSGGGQ
jgi:hypothetical protein